MNASRTFYCESATLLPSSERGCCLPQDQYLDIIRFIKAQQKKNSSIRLELDQHAEVQCVIGK